MCDVQKTDNEAPGIGDSVGTFGDVPDVQGPNPQVTDRYAEGYADGRADAVTAASIFLGLNGFKPDTQTWVDRFRSYVKGSD